MALTLRGTGRSISVSSNNGYTIEKVRRAVEFVKHARRRSTKLEDYLEVYNYLRNANEKLPSCKACGSAKYIAAVENYAKYGYLTLVNSGVDPDILNGTKDYEGSNNGDTVSTDGKDEGVEKKADAVEAQKGAQETSETTEDKGVAESADSVLGDEENTASTEKTDSEKTAKVRTKKVKK